jgi:Alginate export
MRCWPMLLMAITWPTLVRADAASAASPLPTAPGTSPNKPLDQHPAFSILRQDEDWSGLRDKSRRTDKIDALKYVPLNSSGSLWLSLSADAFVSFRSFDDPNLGVGGGFDDTYNYRFNGDLALNVGNRLRLYLALKSGDKLDLRGPVSPSDRKRLDLHQAFVQINVGDAIGLSANDAFVRVGRQELNYGDGRLIAARVGPNAKSDFDGVLLRTRFGKVTTDLLAFKGIIDRTGVFDNGRDRSRSLWGVYSSIAERQANLDLFYLGQWREMSSYAFLSDTLDETRHTLGVRLWRPLLNKRLGFNLGANLQFGGARPSIGQAYRIRAWSFAATLEQSLSRTKNASVLGLETGITSGDTNPGDRVIGTFRSIAPPGRLTGLADRFGPGNLVGIRPYIDLHPSEKIRLRPKITAFWRLKASDGLYSLSPSVISKPKPGNRFAGIEPGVEFEWTAGDHWTVTSFASHFFVANGIGASVIRHDVSYGEVTLAFKL